MQHEKSINPRLKGNQTMLIGRESRTVVSSAVGAIALALLWIAPIEAGAQAAKAPLEEASCRDGNIAEVLSPDRSHPPTTAERRMVKSMCDANSRIERDARLGPDTLVARALDNTVQIVCTAKVCGCWKGKVYNGCGAADKMCAQGTKGLQC
jgi:hypothetical protein